MPTMQKRPVTNNRVQKIKKAANKSGFFIDYSLTNYF